MVRTEVITHSLHDALPILRYIWPKHYIVRTSGLYGLAGSSGKGETVQAARDRNSTRLNSSHRTISYAVFCLKKKTTRHVTEKICTRLTIARLHNARMQISA